MKRFIPLLLLFFISFYTFAQLKVASWNIENLGKSKSTNEILFIVNTVEDFDIVAIQEVVAGPGGAQAIAQLVDNLNRKGKQWDYVVSDPTSSSAYKTERYAFIWQASKVKKLGNAWLEKKFNQEIDREPFYCTFKYGTKTFTLANFHAITKQRQPETEIKYFKLLPEQYPNLNLVFLGDFNCPQSHSVFNPLKKMGYEPVFKGQKTSLKKNCVAGNCLASEFDNIFYNRAEVKVDQKGVLLFYTSFTALTEARKISDHIPIWFQFSLL